MDIATCLLRLLGVSESLTRAEAEYILAGTEGQDHTDVVAVARALMHYRLASEDIRPTPPHLERQRRAGPPESP